MSFLGFQAILCSPLRRTLQTAALALAPHVERGVPWYGVEAAREFSQGLDLSDYSDPSRLLFLVAGGVADWFVFLVGARHARPCDYRRNVELQRSSFPGVDFSRVPRGDDAFAARKEPLGLPGDPLPGWWRRGGAGGESVEDLDLRCCELLQLLKGLPQQQMAVVSHTGGAWELLSC
eukprot:Skav216171  [mRNA]  locus=scaffold2249:34211:35750:+ [translate_table: standard]